jgi:hypothetical protein
MQRKTTATCASPISFLSGEQALSHGSLRHLSLPTAKRDVMAHTGQTPYTYECDHYYCRGSTASITTTSQSLYHYIALTLSVTE